MIPHFVSSLIVHEKVFHLYADIMFYEDIKESGGKFHFLLYGTRWHWTSCHLRQVGLGQVDLEQNDM